MKGSQQQCSHWQGSAFSSLVPNADHSLLHITNRDLFEGICNLQRDRSGGLEPQLRRRLWGMKGNQQRDPERCFRDKTSTAEIKEMTSLSQSRHWNFSKDGTEPVRRESLLCRIHPTANEFQKDQREGK